MATVERWLGLGIARVILGTVAVRDPALVRAAAKAHPGRVAVGIDARGGRVAVEGWAEETDIAVVDLARRFEDAGVAAIIFTDIDRDGMMQGPNVASTAALARAVSIPVIASGGVASMDDLLALAACGAPRTRAPCLHRRSRAIPLHPPPTLRPGRRRPWCRAGISAMPGYC
jgi:phosphoribosylformimino-5-aminoimidazole carboxamide ribotide isomerase